jgi:hypothetical protein
VIEVSEARGHSTRPVIRHPAVGKPAPGVIDRSLRAFDVCAVLGAWGVPDMSLRLYRTSWLVAGVALVVALLTLQTAGPAPEPELPPVFDSAAALTLSGELAEQYAAREPGSPGGTGSARWIATRLAEVLNTSPSDDSVATAPGTGEPAGANRVQTQSFVVRRGTRTYDLTNVYAALPPTSQQAKRGVILVVAPRDTPQGVTGGASATASLVELARAASVQTRRRPMIFLSTDGSTLGNAGIRWFLHRNSRLRLVAAVVLDAPGEVGGDTVDIWASGRTGRQSLEMARLAEIAVERTGGSADATPAPVEQALRLAVPQTFGDQGPLVDAGIPAVTLAGRPDSPLTSTAAPTEARLALVGRAAESLAGAVESADVVQGPDSGMALAGRRLRPTVARIALLLLALPVLVMAVDGFARARRARLRIGRGLRAVWWRGFPALIALAVAYLVSLVSLIPEPTAGAPPSPALASLDGPAAAGLVATALAAFLAWLAAHRRLRRTRALPPEEATAALVGLGALIVLVWLRQPFALLLALPAAHAALLAGLARRAWQVGVAIAVAVFPLAVLCVSIAGTIDGTPFDAAWYLLATSVDGARGWLGPLLAVLIGMCVWSLGGLVAFRARKGLVTAAEFEPVEAVPGFRRPGARRPADRLG